MSSFKNKIIKSEKSIWRYANFYDEFIKPENRLYLADGETREIEIENVNRLSNINHLYFKREDENECGSLKGRSLAYQISFAKQNKLKDLVISTSGNAGIAAAAYCQKAGIKLYIFISPETERAKIAEMQKYDPVIVESKKTIRLANYLSAKYKIKNLRPSMDDSSVEGFKSITFEIFENLGEVDAVFAFVTSGSSFVGVGRAYKYLLENKKIKKIPKLFAIQSGEIFSIAKEFDKINSKDKTNCGAGKLGVKETKRKEEIIKFIKLSGGSGLYVANREIEKAKDILENNGIYTSPEGQANFAGAIREGKNNKFNKAICILSGKTRKVVKKIYKNDIYKAENFEEINRIIKEKLKNKISK